MEDNKNKVLLTVVIAITLLVALVGATFAYFSATGTSTEQTVTTSSMNLKVTIADGTSTHITDIAPTTFNYATVEENINVAAIPFTVTGSSSTAGTYTINLNNNIQLKDSLEDGTVLTGGELSDLKYVLYKLNTDTSEYEAKGTEISFSTASFNLITDETIVTDVDGNINDSYILYVYIKDNGEQNKFQDNDFTITLSGSAKQS